MDILDEFEPVTDEVDHLAKFMIEPKEHIHMLTDPKDREKARFNKRKHTPTGPIAFLTAFPRKYETPLHKKLAKLEPLFDKAVKFGMKVWENRLLRQALSLQERIEGRGKRAASTVKPPTPHPSYWAKRTKKGENDAKKETNRET
jgi:hypothetical protein